MYKLVINIIAFIKVKYFYKRYTLWLFQDRDMSLVTYRRAIITLFKNADIKDAYIPTTSKIGYGRIASFNASIMNSFPSAYEDFAVNITRMFHEAIGVYRSRIFETFSPIYWINSLIFLPKRFLTYLGLNAESVIVKLLQCIWWFIAPIALILRTQIVDYIMHLLPS
ncbi:hypothetical protein [Clostridium sp. HBUAS56017]|uniref:hypothetical protein n=1 Tax=Clostridium sp. HBUAS56017 TaxID=2571128 RepID=UPI001A9BE3A9|nr:hypothetical protein [Clostridium sp. HBUAS56017]